MLLWCLHHLFPPQQKASTEPSGSKIRRKFSVADSQDAFAVLATTSEELDAKLNLLKIQSSNIQPRLLVVGEVNDIKTIFIYLDEIEYPILTVLNAFDILFKNFFAFNLHYPKESEVFYNFMQLFFYDLPSHKKYAKIFTIKHEIINFKT